MKQRKNEGLQHALWSAVERNRRLDLGENKKKQANFPKQFGSNLKSGQVLGTGQLWTEQFGTV